MLAYAAPTKTRMEQRTQLEFRHSAPAFHFTGIPGQFPNVRLPTFSHQLNHFLTARPFLVYINRFHRPDFRWGLYDAHVASQASVEVGSSKSGGSRVGSFVLNFGRRPQRPAGSGSLWGRWVVK